MVIWVNAKRCIQVDVELEVNSGHDYYGSSLLRNKSYRWDDASQNSKQSLRKLLWNDVEANGMSSSWWSQIGVLTLKLSVLWRFLSPLTLKMG